MLINPSNAMPKDSVRRLAPPLGILYLAAVLKKENYDVNILDSTCEGYHNILSVENNYIKYGLTDDDIRKRIKEYNPDIVGVTSMFSAQQDNALNHCNIVKEINKDIIVVLGGIHPSLFPKESIQHKSVDFVIIGEGEFRLIKLLNDLNKNNHHPNFDGVAYKIDGRVHVIFRSTRIEDLDSIPLPSRDLINFEKYIDIGVPYAPFPMNERTCQILTSRGCPFNCNFCSTVKYWGRRFRKRSVDNVINEIEHMVKNYNIKEIQFIDDNMTIDKKRAIELFKRLKKYNLYWCAPHGLMIKTLDKEMIKLMSESGAYQISVAIESGSRRVLKEIIHKPVPTKKEVKEIVDTCHKYKIQVHGLFIVGLPGEKKDEIFDTLQYPFDVGFDSVSFFIANPAPGSELYDECKEKGYLIKDAKIDFKASEINIPKSSPEFVISRDELVKLVDNKTIEFNKFSKQRNPDAWNTKFKKFLDKHGDESDLILGRVT